MSRYVIEVQVDAAFFGMVEERWLSACAEAVLDHEGQPSGSGLTIVITDDAHVQRLNHQYRGVDRPTDVLSFSTEASPGDGKSESFVMPEEVTLYLGDVIVSYPTALAQAREQGHPIEEELALLVVHGCLHLLGYDHADEAQRREMWDRQETILGSVARE